MEEYHMSENKNFEELGKDCTYCKQCGGACCKRSGCHFSPDDFEEISFEYLKDKIESTGYISIDWWEGDPREENVDDEERLSRGLFLRMRHRKSANPILDPFSGLAALLSNTFDRVDTDEPGPIVDAAWGGRCVLHTDEGCPMEYEKRPKGARWLIAKTGPCIPCNDAYSKQQCVIDWIPYQDILLKLEEYFEDRYDIPVNEYK